MENFPYPGQTKSLQSNKKGGPAYYKKKVETCMLQIQLTENIHEVILNEIKVEIQIARKANIKEMLPCFSSEWLANKIIVMKKNIVSEQGHYVVNKINENVEWKKVLSDTNIATFFFLI